MPSKAVEAFRELDLDLENLLSLHPSKGTSGRPAGDTGPLIRSGVVLLATAWETYVEQAIEEAFEHVLQEVGDDHTKLQGGVKGYVENKAKRDPWAVAGSGWKDIARDGVETQVAALNNAGPGQIDGLIAFAFNVEDFVDLLGWTGRRQGTIRPALAELINDVRGDIVHKGKTTKSLIMNDLYGYRTFINQMVKATDAKIATVVKDLVGTPPWAA